MRQSDFLRRLATQYPKTAQRERVSELVIPTLISPVALALPSSLREQADEIVKLFFRRIRPHQAQTVKHRNESLSPLHQIPDPGHASVLMSYDFHVSDGTLKLIEINTNASMSLLADLMNLERGLAEPVRDTLIADFETELGSELKGKHVAIVDTKPEQQKLFIEFLLYKELFEQRGATVQILDPTELEFKPGTAAGKLFSRNGFGPIDLVYNRLTDFDFTEADSVPLRQAMIHRSAVITPHPFEYECLANKSRLIEWSDPSFPVAAGLSPTETEILHRCLLKTRSMDSMDSDALWGERKKWIFKPKTSYGGKAVFRGASISRGVFADLVRRASEFTVQEFAPAPTVQLTEPHCSDCIPGEYKYDLRFFAYRDEIRIACARLYQGQFTNATTPGGGVTSIEWDSTIDPLSRASARTRA